MAALRETAPVDLRVNVFKANRDSARAALAAEGVETEATPLSPVGLRLARRRPLSGLAAIRSGLVDVQDEGSQVIALLVGAQPGETVVDLCAGAGGKSLALAAAMAGLGPRRRRAGAGIVETRELRGETGRGLDDLVSIVDRVLVDVPCSGTGTWRRNPAERWRLTRGRLSRYVARQRAILSHAAPLVRPGGRLIYATCSLMPVENEAQVAWFLDAFGAFTVVPADVAWRSSLPGTAPVDGPYLRLTPAGHGTDGFFAAVLARRD